MIESLCSESSDAILRPSYVTAAFAQFVLMQSNFGNLADESLSVGQARVRGDDGGGGERERIIPSYKR